MGIPCPLLPSGYTHDVGHHKQALTKALTAQFSSGRLTHTHFVRENQWGPNAGHNVSEDESRHTHTHTDTAQVPAGVTHICGRYQQVYANMSAGVSASMPRRGVDGQMHLLTEEIHVGTVAIAEFVWGLEAVRTPFHGSDVCPLCRSTQTAASGPDRRSTVGCLALAGPSVGGDEIKRSPFVTLLTK